MRLAVTSGFTLALASTALPAHAADVALDVTQFQIIKRESGPVDYTSRGEENGIRFLRASYRPGLETVVRGYEVPDGLRRSVRAVRWSWRANKFPIGGDECARDREDSAAVVYLTWKRGMRWYSLKYVWSSVGLRNAVCGSKRNPFVAQDAVILESGPPSVWKDVRIELASVFRRHFADNDPTADVPDFVGIGVMSDGDQTQSESEADYARFVLER